MNTKTVRNLAKSLHTVTAVSLLAKHLQKTNPKMVGRAAIAQALAILGYEVAGVNEILMGKIESALAAL